MKETEKARILIVDDEPNARYAMRKALTPIKAEIREAEDGKQALDKLKSFQPDLVLCDINMPHINGLELLQKVEQLSMPLQELPLFIMITAYGSEKIAVEAMKGGAYDYLSKPYDIEELRLIVVKAYERVLLKRENVRLRQQVGVPSARIIGESEAIYQVHTLVRKVAPTDVTVLITGESGTGKELVAHTIHQDGPRSQGPYITMNCAAIPRDLIESELFGHEKGAFTGAVSQRKGKFELADGGTLFLDEIADMSIETQAKILRVLEDKVFTRLGGKEVIRVDVRLISATNKDLLKVIDEGGFRQDLYYRLKVLEIHLPPLAERKEDIPLLVNFYLNTFTHQHKKSVKRIDAEAMQRLYDYHWPGNIRQLIHAIEQSVVLAEGDKITADDLPYEIKKHKTSIRAPVSQSELGKASFREMKEEMVRRFENELFTSALSQTHGNVSKAARLLRMKRQFLQNKLKMLGIDASSFRQSD